MSNIPTRFTRNVVVRSLRYPTRDLHDNGEFFGHYERFVLRLRGLHALCRDLASDDIRLFDGEADERE